MDSEKSNYTLKQKVFKLFSICFFFDCLTLKNPVGVKKIMKVFCAIANHYNLMMEKIHIL